MLSIPGVSDGKESTCNAGDLGSIPGLGRSPGEENGYPCHYEYRVSIWEEEKVLEMTGGNGCITI